MRNLTIAAAAALTVAASAHAAVVQSPGEEFVAFEAENFDVINIAPGVEPFYSVISDPNASGGQALEATDPGDYTASNSDDDTFVGYDITFAETGTYRLYVRHVAPGGGANSFFTANDFDVDPTSG